LTSEHSSYQTEFSLQGVAKQAWQQALIDFYYPPLPEPIIEHKHDASSYFYINTDDWTVHLNTYGVPLHMDSNEAEFYLRSTCHHEIQHYLVCPYDGVTNAMMFAAARRHVHDGTSMFICNLFADFVVDSKLLKRFPTLSYERINTSIHDSALRVSNHSKLWVLVISCYNAMWGFLIPSIVNVDSDTDEIAKQIVEISRKYLESETRWPKATEQIAKVLKDWIDEDEQELLASGLGFGSSESNDRSMGKKEDIPDDLDKIMGDPCEIRNGDRARRCLQQEDSSNLEEDMERIARELEQRGGTIEDLEGAYILAGIGDKRRQWIRFWYRAKAKGLIRIEVRHRRETGSTPLAPKVWRLGDPVEELDIVQSLQAFPVLVPNITTRQWSRISSLGPDSIETPPDLLIVLDSSGSMTWSMSKQRLSGPYHTALVSAYAALDYVLQKGAEVAIINFSDGVRRCKWTTDRAKLEKRLLAYQGGGTVAPIRDIQNMVSTSDSQVMVLMITDAEIANWDELIDTVRTTTRLKNLFIIFHIGSENKRITKAFQNAGGTLFSIKSIKDLPGLVIRQIRSVYDKTE
jgi:hypothetical protein